MAQSQIQSLLGSQAEFLLDHSCKTIDKSMIHAPGYDFVDRIFAQSNRNPQVLKSLQQLYGNGRLANSGYLSILPVDQGIEHSAGASFAPNPIYFDSENIIKLAIEGWVLPFTSEVQRAVAKSLKWHKHLSALTNWVWLPFCGVTPVTTVSKWMVLIITPVPI